MIKHTTVDIWWSLCECACAAPCASAPGMPSRSWWRHLRTQRPTTLLTVCVRVCVCARSTLCLSTWYAEQELVAPQVGTKAYYLTVEEPFDAADNCARTLGSKVGAAASLLAKETQRGSQVCVRVCVCV